MELQIQTDDSMNLIEQDYKHGSPTNLLSQWLRARSSSLTTQKGETEKPVESVILDWQISSVHSPVLDVCHFIYSSSSSEELDKFEQLIKFYYDNLSKFVREMGSDPEKIFPFRTFLDHWKRFAVYGLLFPLSFLVLVVADESETAEIDFSDPEVADKLSSLKAKNQEDYQNRVLAVLRHYCKTCIDF